MPEGTTPCGVLRAYQVSQGEVVPVHYQWTTGIFSDSVPSRLDMDPRMRGSEGIPAYNVEPFCATRLAHRWEPPTRIP